MADSTTPTAVNQNLPKFDTDEILWYKNGIWGDAGYAIPNPMAKTITSNSDIYELHSLCGKTMFQLLHDRNNVAFTTPPSKQWLFNLHQMLVVARKRLSDLTRLPNDSNGLDVQHAQPDRKMFLLYPVPYFGERIRNADIAKYAQIALMMLSEIMQHTDNDRVGYITQAFSGEIGKYLQEILAQMGMKFFGYARADAYKLDFQVKDTDFANYDPSKLMISTELTDERPPDQWWPTTNDLSLISGLPAAPALTFAARWPIGPSLYSGDAGAFPGVGSSGVDANTASGTTAAGATAAGTFVTPPGQAP